MNSSQRTKLPAGLGLLGLAFVSILFLSPAVAASAPPLSPGSLPSSSYSVSPSVTPITLTSPQAQFLGNFGTSVAVSGKTVVVGAPSETANGFSNAGHAYTFNAKTGALISTLTSPNAQTGGYFGYSVAVSGSTVVVGAVDESAATKTAAGHAYTFNAKTGALISTLTSPNAQSIGEFGFSVAAAGKFVMVGAPYEIANGFSNAGHAYIF